VKKHFAEKQIIGNLRKAHVIGIVPSAAGLEEPLLGSLALRYASWRILNAHADASSRAGLDIAADRLQARSNPQM
jgi:hypothetical protein